MKRLIETFLIIVITWSIRIFIFLGFFAFLCPNNFTLNTRIFSTPEIFEPAWIDYCCFSILFRIEINDDRSFGIWHTVMAHNLWLLIYNRVTHSLWVIGRPLSSIIDHTCDITLKFRFFICEIFLIATKAVRRPNIIDNNQCFIKYFISLFSPILKYRLKSPLSSQKSKSK